MFIYEIKTAHIYRINECAHMIQNSEMYERNLTITSYTRRLILMTSQNLCNAFFVSNDD